MSSSESCQTCQTGWVIPQGSQYCTQCDCLTGYTLSGTNCVFGSITVSTCTGLSTLIPDCLVLDFTQNPTACSDCGTGKVFSGGACIVNNCLTSNCNQCVTGYLKPQGSNYCSACDCKNGYIASGLSCVQGYVYVSSCSGSNGLIPHCNVFYFSGGVRTCNLCDPGYQWDKNQCSATVCKNTGCVRC